MIAASERADYDSPSPCHTKNNMLQHTMMVPDYLSLLCAQHSFDLRWDLGNNVALESAQELLQHFRNRFPVYDLDNQILHLNYTLQTDHAHHAIGFSVDECDSIPVPLSAIQASPNYVIPGALLQNEQPLMAFWHDKQTPPVIASIATAVAWMTQGHAPYFLPVLHEKSLATLPDSGALVLRLYQLDCQRLFGYSEQHVRQLQTRIISAMQWLS